MSESGAPAVWKGLLMAFGLLVGEGKTCSSASEPPPTKFRGTLTMVYFLNGAWSTNIFIADVDIAHPHWQMTLKGGRTHQKMTGDGKEIKWAAFYPHIPKDGPMNTSMLKVFSGNRPYEVREEEHIWMALLSSDTFRAESLPLEDKIGLCIRGPGKFTQIQHLKGAVSPVSAAWYNSRADLSPTYPRINGKFTWLGETNFGGFRFPLRSRLEMSLRYHDQPAEIPASISEFEIMEIGPSVERPPFSLNLEGKTAVYDFRQGPIPNREPLAYDIKDGNLPAADSPRLREIEDFSKKPAEKETLGRRRWAVRIILVSIAIAGGGFCGDFVSEIKNKNTKEVTMLKSTTHTRRKQFVAGAVMMSAVSLWAACSYLQEGGNASCNSNSQCSSYYTPTAVTCNDAGSSTSAEPGNTEKKTVTRTTYTGGSCSCGTCDGGSTKGACQDGTAGGTSQVEIENKYCKGCSAG